MGMFNFLKRNNKQVNKSNVENNIEKPIYDIQYFSKSAGCDMNINISDEIIEINGKKLARAMVTYGNTNIGSGEAQVLANEIYMEPILSTMQNVEVVNNTKQFYQELIQKNPSMCKAFFRKEDIQSSPTKYIGALGKTKNSEFNGNKYKD